MPNPPELLASLEALLFASDAPLPLERVAEVLEIAVDEARPLVEALREACDEPGRGLSVVEVAGGVRLVTRPELAGVLLRLQRLRAKSRMSRAAVETLAIIAYRQPIARAEIEQLRGVGADSVLTHLLERRLVRVVGRKAAPGRPILYGTTRDFLEHFGLRDLGDLPAFEATPGARPPAPAEASGPTEGSPAGAVGDPEPEDGEGSPAEPVAPGGSLAGGGAVEAAGVVEEGEAGAPAEGGPPAGP